MPQPQDKYDILTQAISRVLTPVMICMVLSVWFVHGVGDPVRCKEAKSRQLEDISLFPSDSTNLNSNSASAAVESTSTVHSSFWAGIFIGGFILFMIVFTFIIVWLYKSGRRNIIQGWITISVFVIFAYVGGLYIFDFCRSHCINLDWITLSLAVWNFTITGLFAVFGVVPRIVNQAYLIIMSALMAYIFRTLPSWAIWTILGALVVWDLFAVLSKYGPLKKLVEAAREQGDPLPALVYDTNPHDAGRDPEERANAILKKSREDRRRERSARDRRARSAPGPAPVGDAVNGSNPATENEQSGEEQSQRRKLFRKREKRRPAAVDNSAADVAEMGATEEDTAIRIGTLGAHLKLGLGDFVFYSILVAEASKSSAMTAITSFVAILAGLCVTLFLVTVCRKALPALPISITAGLLFFFLTRYTVQPFVINLLPELLFH